MATIGQMIDDLELRLFGGKPSDDSPIPRAQMRFWLDSANAQTLSAWVKINGEVPAYLISRLECLLIKSSTPTCISGCTTYEYIELPKNSRGNYKSVLSLPEDRGIIQVVMGENSLIRLTNPRQLSMMIGSKFGDEYGYFYRIGGKIYIFNGVYPSFCRMSVDAVVVDTSDTPETDPYPTIDELIPAILEQAEKIGTRELGSRYDLQDDGI
jgi:hypothetical protein